MLLLIALVSRWYHALSSNHLSDVMRPILLPLSSVNQRLPSGPAAISLRRLGTGNSVIVPLGLIPPDQVITPAPIVDYLVMHPEA